jgi:hypothetical protein
MIKLDKGSAPQYLMDNKARCLRELNDTIATYGSFSKIPCGKRENLIRY